jgi:hypothetical protein
MCGTWTRSVVASCILLVLAACSPTPTPRVATENQGGQSAVSPWPDGIPVEGLYDLEIIQLEDNCDPPLPDPMVLGNIAHTRILKLSEFEIGKGGTRIDFSKAPPEVNPYSMKLDFFGTIEAKATKYSASFLEVDIRQIWKKPNMSPEYGFHRESCVAHHKYVYRLEKACSGACLESAPSAVVTEKK